MINKIIKKKKKQKLNKCRINKYNNKKIIKI